MTPSCFNHILIILRIILLLSFIFPYTISAQGGSWQLLLNNSGIAAMHMQLLHNDRVIMYDRTTFGPSNITLPNCTTNGNTDCTAHAVEYDSLTNTLRPLNLITDTWCSSGTVFGDGHLVQTGGWGRGDRAVRTFYPNCNASECECEWEEDPNGLLEHRWYSTNHVLPDGSTIIIGGRNAFNYEFFPKTPTSTLINFPFLRETFTLSEENNLYPFVFLHVDGNLFVFANNRAILLNYTTNIVVRSYPVIPGGDPRSYPSTGSAVLLPLKNLELGDTVEMEVLICGGGGSGAFVKADQSEFIRALNTCARMRITDPNPSWVMETMPLSRVMGDMVPLPNGDVLIINGAGSGAAGWEKGRDPVLSPVIYHPDNVLGSRFEVMSATTIPRMYHSSAVLLRDGRVLVGGGNPHEANVFTNVLFPTELRLEAFLPPYMDPIFSSIRPSISSHQSRIIKIKYGSILKIKIRIRGLVNPTSIKVTMVRPPFSTHSFSMSQRLLVLTNAIPIRTYAQDKLQLQVKTPGSANIAPPGYYMLFVVHQNVPSHRNIWVQIE